MWTRESIKNYAKGFLKKHYWKAFLVCLIVTLLTSSGSRLQASRDRQYLDLSYRYTIEKDEIQVPMEVNNPIFNYIIRKLGQSPVLFFTIPTLIAFGIIAMLFWITIGYALEVGKVRFFLRGFDDDVDVGNLFSTFNRYEYMDIVKTIFVRNLYTLLWTLLLIIPGIVKGYEYKMVPYIVSEHPNLKATEAISRSREMTDGHKLDMFILDLSFLGWYILGLLFFGIGSVFVNPYVEASYAKLYNTISGNDDISKNDDIEDIYLEI